MPRVAYISVVKSKQVAKLLYRNASERLSLADELCAISSADDEMASPPDGEIAFAKARLESYLKNPKDTVSWSKIREVLVPLA